MNQELRQSGYLIIAQSTYIIANPMYGLSFGRGFWSPDRDLLAFSQFDLNTSTNSLQVYDQANDNNWYLEIEEPQPYDEADTLPGLFLFGWSGDSEWLAYDYIYDVVQPDPKLVNLLNVFTMANVSVEIPNPDGYLWLAWSPDNSTFAVTNSKSIFVGETQSSEQLVIHPGQGFLGLIAWHPHKNFLVVGSSDNMAVEGINQLWQLNLDTGEWVHMGSYQHINNVAFSPNGHYLAVHSQYLELKHLDIVDATTFKTIHQIDLPMDLLFDLDWINDSTVGLTSKNNIFVIPLEDAMNSYWLFEPNSQLYNNSFSQINIMDW